MFHIRRLIYGVQLYPGSFVIRNDRDYKGVFSDRLNHPNCNNYELPEIDFTNHTLLGYYSGVAGCEEPSYVYSITKQHDSYRVAIHIVQRGKCLRNNRILLWCLIPKIDADAMVHFQEHITIEE